MSYRQIQAIGDIKDLCAGEKYLLTALCVRSGPMEQVVKLTSEYLLERTSLNIRTYRKYIRNMVEKGYIRYKSGIGREASLFVLTLPEALLTRYRMSPALTATLANGRVNTNHLNQLIEEIDEESLPEKVSAVAVSMNEISRLYPNSVIYGDDTQITSILVPMTASFSGRSSLSLRTVVAEAGETQASAEAHATPSVTDFIFTTHPRQAEEKTWIIQ